MWEIYSIWMWQWWASLIWFLVAVGISWFVPGWLLARYTSFSQRIQFLLAPVFGICFWALQGYLLGWLQLRWMTYPLLLLFAFLAWKVRHEILPLRWTPKWPRVVWIVLFFGIFLQLVPVLGSGWRTALGPTYYFVNIYDGIFHLSLSRSLVESVPPYQPGAAGMVVTNYHYLSNLVVAELSRVWLLPLNHVHFHFVPLFLATWMGLVLTALLQGWSKNTRTVVFGLVLFYVAGELTWLIDIVLGGNAPEPFEVFVDHGVLQFLNPPQAFAKLVFFSVLLLWHEFWQKRSLMTAFCIGVLTACLLGFKVYFGLAAGLGMVIVAGMTAALELRKPFVWRKTLVPFLVMGVVTAVLGAAIYLPANAAAGGLFFDFLTWPKLLLGVQKLNWNEWWLRLQVYQAAGNTRALVVWYSLAAGIFAAAIYHLRLLGFLAVFPRLRQKLAGQELLFLLVPALVFTLIGSNFLQTSGGSNSFNFMVVAIAILNPITAVVLGALRGQRFVQFGVGVLLAVTVVQTGFMQYFYFKNYLRGTDGFSISASHEEALTYMADRQYAGEVLQTHPNHVLEKVTPYIYFFTGRRTYLGGVGILDSHNQDTAARKVAVDRMLALDPTRSAELAQDLTVTHLLLRKGELLEDVFMNSATFSATLSAIPHWLRVVNNPEVVLLERVIPEGWVGQELD